MYIQKIILRLSFTLARFLCGLGATVCRLYHYFSYHGKHNPWYSSRKTVDGGK